jgi:amino acid adenylation domain-containing protein
MTAHDSETFREELVRRRMAGNSAKRRATIPRADRDQPLSLSSGQRQLWFLNRLDSGSPEYLVPLALRLRGPLDEPALRRVWAELVRRHEILRTRYALADAEPVQVVDEPAAPAWTTVDLADVPLDEREAAALAHAEREALVPFDLERHHPLRLTLLRVTECDHLLVAVFHHIASDQVSQEVLLTELAALYQDYAGGVPALLAEPSVQYADYAAWQRDNLSDEVVDSHLLYWHQQLADLPRLELPTDYPRPAVRGWEGAGVPVAVPAETVAALRGLADGHNATLFMVLLTAFQCLLARYTGQDDIAVGTVVSGRSHPDLGGLVGYVMNNLVLRLRIEGTPSFESTLLRNRLTVLEGFDRQHVPFARLVDELQPERDMSVTPLFQVAFTMHELPDSGTELAGLRVEHADLAWRVAKYDLSLRLAQLPDGSLGGQIEYATDLFAPATVRRVAGHFARFVDSIAADPRTGVHDLDLLPEHELEFLLRSSVPQPEPSDRCLHEVFAAQVERTPDAVAVVCDGVRSSYRELNSRANRLAHHLRALGAGPESVVGVCLDRDDHLVPTLLGVTKSGAGYLPLDPAYPADRLRFMITDAGAPIVVTTSAHLPLVRDIHAGHVVVLDDDAALSARPEHDPAQLSVPDNLAYVIYTSGSTGLPKGVCVTHRNVARLFTSSQRHYDFGERDVWSMFHSYAFDVSVWELWGALLHGGRLVVVPFEVSRSPEDFLELLVTERVTVLSQTPSAFRSLITADTGDDRLAALTLRAVVFAGEKLELRELTPWVKRFGLDAPALINMYGITETTVHSTFHRTVEENLEPGAGNPIGYPLDDLRIHLLDQHGNLVPVGIPGEIHVGGPGVARGYLGRPALTAQRFVPDPFGGPGERLYRSGDLARRLPNGSLEFLGRIDHQVKLRGFRIELGEITAKLLGHPSVRDAVVVLREDTPGDSRLVAYLVPDGDAVPEPGELRSLLAKDLPDYMIPAAYVPLDRIPLTTNGKLDQRALPAPDGTAVRAAGVLAAPRTVTEARMASLWREVLGVQALGIHDGFFDVGGDSIRAVGLVGALRLAGFDVSVRDVFSHRTVALLAEYVDERAAPAPIDTPVERFALICAADRDRLPAGLDDAYPMSEVQTGMLVEMLASGGGVYHNISSFKVRDTIPFELDALRASARNLLRRHEILRTGLDVTTYSVPMQLVHADATMSVGVRDLRGLDRSAQREALLAFTASERADLFDVTVPPLIRVFAHVVEDGWWVSITECHAILEGWSFHSMLMELLTVYGLARDGRPVDLPETPSVRYADFIAAEIASIDSEQDRRYWREIAVGHPKLELPAAWRDDSAAPRQSYRIDLECADIMADLRGLAKTAQTSVKSVLHAAYLTVMGALTDQESFTTGLVCDTRPEVLGADRVYGMYLNTVPFPFACAAATWRDLVRATFAQHVDLWPHRRFPLSEIQRAAGAGQRLVDTFFIYLDFHVVDTGLVEPDTVIDDSPNEFGLTLAAMGDRIMLHAGTDVLSHADAERLVAMYRAVLESMIADFDGPAHRTFLPQEESTRLLLDWNDTARPLDSTGVIERVRELAARQPDAVAVLDDSGPVTYRSLAGRADALAARLGPLAADTPVAILGDPGAGFVAAVLGVLGAGGAYLPLDAGAPVPRTARLLADSGVTTVLAGAEHAAHASAAAEGLPVEVLVLDDTEHAQGEWALPRGGERDLAYVIYTSGSTGAPKGAMVHRRGMVNHLLAKVEDLGLGEGDTVVQNAPLTFDVSVWQMLAVLLVGGRVRVVSRSDAADPAVLFGRVRDYGVTVLEVVPSLLRAAMDAWDAGGRVPDLTGLRWLVVTGEALPPELTARWFARFPAIPMVNAYGPTECSDDVTHAVLTTDTVSDRSLVPIGRPIRNTRLYVLDGRRQLVPVGIPGELYVGGTGVGRGYLNDPERTAAAFVADPFVADPDARLYRTGDRVRYRGDGQLEFVGRRDSQVKIRGQRVELGEVEAALRALPDVTDTAVAVDAGRLVGYLVGTADPVDVRRRLEETVPGHLVPSAFVVLDALPLTANGKVDRKALPRPDQAALSDGPVTPPRTDAEKRVAEVWRGVLSVEEVGVEDDFFLVGGDSIRVISLVSALQGAGVDLSVRDVFECRTIARLAARLSTQDSAGAALAWLNETGSGATLYCAHPQGGSAHWFLPLADELGGLHPVAAFEAAARFEGDRVDLAELAATYVKDVRTDRPFHLLGWSSGATLAWEMAAQLASAGTPATSLVLIDPIGDPAVSVHPESTDVLFERLAELLAGAATGSADEVEHLLRLAHLSTAAADRDAMRGQVERTRVLTEAMYTYHYPRAGTPVRLLITDQCAEERHGVLRGRTYQDYLARWRELAGAGVTVTRMTGEHEEVLRPTKGADLARLVRSLVAGRPTTDGGTR